jgi:methylmalonyl-CoA mutase cobalamin-binding domain/chain
MTEAPKPRGARIGVVVAKPGLDGDEPGPNIVARALRDADTEVIHTGLDQKPGQIVETVTREDPDAVGLSMFSGAVSLAPRVVKPRAPKGLRM